MEKISFFAPQKERERERDLSHLPSLGGKKRKKNFSSKTGFSKFVKRERRGGRKKGKKEKENKFSFCFATTGTLCD